MYAIQKKVKNSLSIIQQLTSNVTRAHWSCGDFKTPTTCIVKKQRPEGFKLTVLHAGSSHLINRESMEGTAIPLREELLLLRRRLSNISTKAELKKRVYTTWEMDIDEMGSINPLPESGRFRSVIPLKKRFEFELFKSNLFDNDVTGGTRGLLEATIEGNVFHIYCIRDEKQHYLVMDALQTLPSADFNEYCWSMSISLGFITGRFSQGEQYIFYFTAPDMDRPVAWRYMRLRPSIDSIYAATSPRPQNVLHPSGITQILMHEEPTDVISRSVLENLSSWIHKRDSHKAAVLLIIEAKEGSLLIRPAGLAIALEGLATIFEEMFAERVKPIKNKDKATLLIKELSAILETRAGDTDFDVRVLLAKLNDLNKPTNRSRLKKPFEILGVPINLVDEKALEYRNAILHGNVILEPVDKKTFEMEADELAYRLLTLANAIILKLSGYSGWIINHPKMQLEAIEEDHFRDLGPTIISYDELFGHTS